nr:uncharacterized protein LOC127344759 [Lolium perenne]
MKLWRVNEIVTRRATYPNPQIPKSPISQKTARPLLPPTGRRRRAHPLAPPRAAHPLASTRRRPACGRAADRRPARGRAAHCTQPPSPTRRCRRCSCPPPQLPAAAAARRRHLFLRPKPSAVYLIVTNKNGQDMDG